MTVLDDLKSRSALYGYNSKNPKNSHQAHLIAKLHDAVIMDDFDEAKMLLEGGLDVNSALGQSMETPLFTAAKEGGLAMTRFLIEKGANPLIGDRNDTLPLHIACEYEPKIALYLINGHNDINAIGRWGRTPLHIAAAHQPELAKLLIQRNALVEAYDNDNSLPIDLAENFGNYELLAFMQKNELSKEDSKGFTPLMRACHGKITKYVLSLIDEGADMRAENSQGKTAFDILKRKRNLKPELQSLKEKMLLENELENNEYSSISL